MFTKPCFYFFIGFSFSSKSIALSLSSEPLLSSFVALYVASHVYTRDTPYNTAIYRLVAVYATLIRTMVLSFSIHTCDACTYHRRWILPFIVRACVTLLRIITYYQCGARSGSPQLSKCLLCQFYNYFIYPQVHECQKTNIKIKPSNLIHRF